MTAEVAIANSNAVAMAADSAVTVGGRKIYNSAIKLFSFSKVEPVGIMVYGNANLIDVPWETIIKESRKHLGTRSYPAILNYGQYLIDFLKNNKNLIKDKSQKAWLMSNAQGYYDLIKGELKTRVENHLKSASKITMQEATDFFEEIVSQHHQILKSHDYSTDFDAEIEAKIRKKYVAMYKESITKTFQELKIKRHITAKLNDIATFVTTRAIYPKNTSGIVIGGFGTDEIFPSIYTYEIEGMVEGRLKYRTIDQKCYSVSGGNDCMIVPFAQDDMVSAFMNGINPEIQTFIRAYLTQIFNMLPKLLDDNDLQGSSSPPQNIKDKLQESARKLHSDMNEELDRLMQNNHIAPVLNMVTALPKDELAAMAESMVNLTAFKRRMTESLETVGGPIDVLVISKGDGLVWVKRKHYFPPELNANFFSNYFRGLSDDD